NRTARLTVLLQDRKQQELALALVDHTTWKVKPLVTEKDVAWVNIPPNIPQWSEGKFLWLSTVRDKLELQERDADGKLHHVSVGVDENVVEFIKAYRHERGGLGIDPFH